MIEESMPQNRVSKAIKRMRLQPKVLEIKSKSIQVRNIFDDYKYGPAKKQGTGFQMHEMSTV